MLKKYTRNVHEIRILKIFSSKYLSTKPRFNSTANMDNVSTCVTVSDPRERSLFSNDIPADDLSVIAMHTSVLLHTPHKSSDDIATNVSGKHPGSESIISISSMMPESRWKYRNRALGIESTSWDNRGDIMMGFLVNNALIRIPIALQSVINLWLIG